MIPVKTAKDIDHIIDSSVVLTALKGAPGWEEAEARFYGGGLLVTSLCEVAAELMRQSQDAAFVRSIIEELPVSVVAADPEVALMAGCLEVAMADGIALSTADRLCLAYGRVHAKPVDTANSGWRNIVIEDVQITVIA